MVRGTQPLMVVLGVLLWKTDDLAEHHRQKHPCVPAGPAQRQAPSIIRSAQTTRTLFEPDNIHHPLADKTRLLSLLRVSPHTFLPAFWMRTKIPKHRNAVLPGSVQSRAKPCFLGPSPPAPITQLTPFESFQFLLPYRVTSQFPWCEA